MMLLLQILLTFRAIAAAEKMSKVGRISWNVISMFEVPLVKVKRWNPERFEKMSKTEECSELATEGKLLPSTSTAAVQVTDSKDNVTEKVAETSSNERATSTRPSEV